MLILLTSCHIFFLSEEIASSPRVSVTAQRFTVDLITKAQTLNPLAKRKENCLWDLWCMGQTIFTERQVFRFFLVRKIKMGDKISCLQWSVSGFSAVLGKQLCGSVMIRFKPPATPGLCASAGDINRSK